MKRKRILIGAGLIMLIISFYASLLRIFFDYSSLTAFVYIFFISLALFILLRLYKVHKNPKAAVSRAERSFDRAVNYSFQLLLIAFLLLLLINEFRNIRILNLNYFMGIVILFGVLAIFFPYEEKKKRKEKPNRYLSIGLGIVGAAFVFFKTKEMGYLSYIIAVISFVLIMLLSSIVYEED